MISTERNAKVAIFLEGLTSHSASLPISYCFYLRNVGCGGRIYSSAFIGLVWKHCSARLLILIFAPMHDFLRPSSLLVQTDYLGTGLEMLIGESLRRCTILGNQSINTKVVYSDDKMHTLVLVRLLINSFKKMNCRDSMLPKLKVLIS